MVGSRQKYRKKGEGGKGQRDEAADSNQNGKRVIQRGGGRRRSQQGGMGRNMRGRGDKSEEQRSRRTCAALSAVQLRSGPLRLCNTLLHRHPLHD